jgi:hypothetical protein
MPSNQAQDFLFQRIKEILPPSVSLTDCISEILHISTDSAYRRIRNETPLVLEEAKELCEHFHLSLDQILNIKKNSVLFENIKINNRQYTYTTYLEDLVAGMRSINSFDKKEIVYLTKDVPFFHNFYFQPSIAFRYFFWNKIILQHPDFVTRGIDLNGVPANIKDLSDELAKLYTQIPSTEIWNIECVNSVISQIEFCKDSGLFSSSKDIYAVYQSVKETILHLKEQVEYGCKFMPGENSQTKKENFKFFFNRVAMGDNTILIITGNSKSVYLSYDVLNLVVTRDESFCDQCRDGMLNLMRRSTLISQTSEKQRNIFFGVLLTKIEDRQKKL